MKIGRSSDHVSITLTTIELAQLMIKLNLDPGRHPKLLCWGRYVPSEDEFHVHFGQGRAFLPNDAGTFWTAQLSADGSGAQRLEVFGMTPTTGNTFGNVLRVAIPDVRAPLRRRAPVMTKTRPYVPADRPHLGHRPAPQPVVIEPGHTTAVSEQELLGAQSVFNRAIERGFTPQFDARGRILFFDRRVGGA